MGKRTIVVSSRWVENLFRTETFIDRYCVSHGVPKDAKLIEFDTWSGMYEDETCIALTFESSEWGQDDGSSVRDLGIRKVDDIQ